MKRTWDIEELIEHFTLVPPELELLGNKTGATRLGFALLLKCFQLEGLFPTAKHEIPRSVIDYVAHQLQLDAALFSEYDWEGRTITNHRTQIREHFEFREATSADAEEVTNWLVSTGQAAMPHLERLKATVYARFRELRLLPPTPERIERLIHSACATAEQQFFAETFARLSDTSRTRLDALLTSSLQAEEENEEEAPAETGEEAEEDEETVPLDQVTWHDLKLNPGPVGVKSVRQELAKLRTLEHLQLPEDLFNTVPTKVLSRCRQRAATETLHELRRHPDATHYALLAAFCWQRRHELLDTLIDLLLLIIHKIGTRAEKRVDKELLEDFKRVDGKGRLLYRVAEASLAQPDGIVREVVYKVVGEQRLKDIVKEYKASGTAYQAQVHTVMRASYQKHYRQVVPLLLSLLDIRSNNEVHRPVIQALAVVKRYARTSLVYYPIDEVVPLEEVVKLGFRELVEEKDAQGELRINRINYELSVLEALREKLRCRELWVAGAGKYGNPEDDLPQDFDEQRASYYQALSLPQDASQFIDALQAEMREALAAFNGSLPQEKVRILNRGGGWISLSPLEPQEEPRNLGRLKGEIGRRWPMTSLLDILKEADLRLDFTQHFKSPATREVLDREVLRKRLLLSLYAMGTNTGLKRVSTGEHGEAYQDLLYVRRRFIQKDQLRAAIADVANAIFCVRREDIWGEATTTCASDSKQFGSWDHNLLTEWHLRYGGKGIMIYWHVEKHSVCIYSQLKTVSSSEVAAMIQGVMRHCTDMQVQKQFVDSHGQSEIAFGFCRLLGFELMPRLKNIYEQKLYLVEAADAEQYPKLGLILSRAINWELIHQQYDQMVKYATALRLGTAETEAILRRFTRTGLAHPTYRAFLELGKAVKTIFLCRYLSSEALRREIHEGLNVIENWNGATAFIFYGHEGDFQTNRLDEQELAALSLHLLQICLIYINTLLVQRVLAEPKHFQAMQPADWRGLTPLFYQHVNPYGTFRLDMNQRMHIDEEDAIA